jgi:hypothetical protein
VSNNLAGVAFADPDDLPLPFVSSPCCQPRPGKVWGSFSTALTVKFEAFDTFIESLSAAKPRKGRECAPRGTVVRRPKRRAQTSVTSLLLSEANPTPRKLHIA